MKYLEDPCVWVESNTTTLSILSSRAEIGLGWLLLVSLFSWQRNIVRTFMYWQEIQIRKLELLALSIFYLRLHKYCYI
ncbi:hypothetical protein ES288_A10G278000v1 [Gossypium darwinii]|uniref:Uncharacterized protein n=1 Tax=Gossypium darwinii TaxID=34276 RepID=A0A5D2F5H6_GOSDA|nr:hypothetical protein ES288_A10G278000v1 [Gossypium darwinii]